MAGSVSGRPLRPGSGTFAAEFGHSSSHPAKAHWRAASSLATIETHRRRNFAALNKEAGLDRELTASRNTVPAMTRAEDEDLEEAWPLLGPTLECFDHLEVVILSGTAARSRRKDIEARGIKAWNMPHPSPSSLRFNPEEPRRRSVGHSAGAESTSATTCALLTLGKL